MTVPTIFISYSHKDEDWKNRLLTQLKVLQYEDIIDLWEDRRIDAGEYWYEEIQQAINKANVAILLISADFLTSKFIRSEEVPKILERRDKEGLRIFPIIIKPCPWKHVKWLSQMNLRPKDGKPLSGGNEHQIDTDLMNIVEEVAAIIKPCTIDVVGDKGSLIWAPEKISISKLPSNNPEFFGREKQLKMLDDAWANHKINIVSIVAWGGVGKTTLVKKWLNQMRDDNYRGAKWIYAWSFYSQGASEKKQVSTDLFIVSALEWFGDPYPNKGSPWEKGERLAGLIKKKQTLLILDGLEPLQNPPGEKQGRIKDPALQCLLKELANHNPGLCIITTRIEVDDIKDFTDKMVQKIPLDHLSSEEGAKLLEHLGVKGTFDELKQAVVEFDGHALALSLLGRYLTIVYHGDIRQRDKIAKLTDEEIQGGHARRVIESYEKWFEGKPELNILRIMGLFDRSAEGGAILAIIASSSIKGLTSELQELPKEKWKYALYNLRGSGLLAKEDPGRPDTLDCHPMIREYFGEYLKKADPTAWKEAHSRLYKYYKSQAKQYPRNLEEMIPLMAAIAHGCEAGFFEEAFYDLFYRRIDRGNEYFITSKLGAFGAALSALSGYFEKPWDVPVANLTEQNKAYVLSKVGFYLEALGRLSEAIQPLQSGLNYLIESKDWENVAISAGILSHLYLNIGDISQALVYAQKEVEFADFSCKKDLQKNSLTTLATALYYLNRISEAKDAFTKAEIMQKRMEKKNPFLYSVDGFEYCDLLLSQGKYLLVRTRASQAIMIAKQNHLLLEIALNTLSLGSAYMLQAQEEKSHDFTKAVNHLNQAVAGLRQAGAQEYIARGLLARAKLNRVRDDLELVKHDLNEAMSLSERCGMGLCLADCHLEYTRLYYIKGNKVEAQENLAKAKEMIEKMGYHLRDKDIKEIEEQL